jgi:hemolysin activation/secretion protein
MNRRACYLLAPAAAMFLSVSVAVSQEAAVEKNTEAEKEKLSFNIWEYRVLGNSTLASMQVEQVLYPMTGASKTIDDVEKARLALEKAYHDAGYGTVFVDIPEQNTDDGVVRLRVTEGRLDRIRVSGARYFSNGQIRAALPALTRDEVPYLPNVQSQLTALNRITADRVITPVLKAGSMPGTVDVELKVKDKLPLHGELEVNDRYTADTSRLRLNASLSYNNLFQRQQSLSVQYQTAPQEKDDVEAIIATYVARVTDWNTTFALYGVDSKTDVAALGTLSVIGNGSIIGFRAIRELPASEGLSHNVTFGLDYKDFLESIQLTTSQELRTPIRYLNWSIAYANTVNRQRTVTGLNLAANFGLRNVVNDSVQFQEKRFNGQSNYFYLRGGMQQSLSLPWDLNLFGKITGQFTQDPLVSNEQLAMGGADSVRGYLESSQLGDYGAVGTIELRSLSLSKLLGSQTGGSYVFAFYDAGVVSLLDPLPSQASRSELSSFGAGIRVNDWYGFDAALDWARVLKSEGKTYSGDSRTHFSVRYSF